MVATPVVTELSAMKVKNLVDAYRDYCTVRQTIYKGTNTKHRMPNFPEDISENIIRQYILNVEKRNCIWNTKMGDLEILDPAKSLQVEVKCFSSTGPLSFGPTERWDELYWLDATDLIFNENIKIYHTKYAFEDEIIKTIPVNKKETFYHQCRQKRRPRFTLSLLQKHEPSAVVLVYSGKLDGILHGIDHSACDALHDSDADGIARQLVQCRI